MLEDSLRNNVCGFKFLIVIEGPREGNLITCLHRLLIHPGVRVVRLHHALDESINILAERDIFFVGLGFVSYGLSLLVADHVAFLVVFRRHYLHSVETELDRLDQRALDTDLFPVGQLVDIHGLVLGVFAIGFEDEIATSFGDVVLFVADAFTALLKALGCVDEENLALALRCLVLAEHPQECRDARVVEGIC